MRAFSERAQRVLGPTFQVERQLLVRRRTLAVQPDFDFLPNSQKNLRDARDFELETLAAHPQQGLKESRHTSFCSSARRSIAGKNLLTQQAKTGHYCMFFW